MSENKIAKVAEFLGIKIGQLFRVDFRDTRGISKEYYILTLNGLYSTINEYEEINVLIGLLLGIYSIAKDNKGELTMAENKIAEVAKLLGVEIGEEFLVFNDMGELVGKGKHKFDDKGLWLIYDNKIGSVNQHLIYLLNGAWTIKKLWKPKENERYWTYRYDEEKLRVVESFWTNDVLDKLLYRNGFCYKTREEAEANKSKAEKYFNNDRIVDWEKTND